jgi:ABC-type transporter Mla maintaining outer membrane lipid asymmetry ATPase subunit MlaF
MELTASIRKIREDFDLTVFMIEHHMDLVMEISDAFIFWILAKPSPTARLWKSKITRGSSKLIWGWIEDDA